MSEEKVYTIAIVDDEKEEADSLSRHIEKFFAERKETCKIVEFSDGSELLKGYAPVYDVIFMDIEMEQVNGMRAARKIREIDENTAIVFVTRMARYAVKGYEVNALDFIVKPVDYGSFVLKMKRVITYLQKNSGNMVTIRQENNMFHIPERDIHYIETMNHYVVYLTSGGVYKEWGTLKQVEDSLSKGCFKSCNRCYLVNLRHVRSVNKNTVTVGNDELIISRYRKKEFLESIAEYWGAR